MPRMISLLGGLALIVAAAGCAGTGTGDTPSSSSGTPPPVRESTSEAPVTPSLTIPENTDTMTLPTGPPTTPPPVGETSQTSTTTSTPSTSPSTPSTTTSTPSSTSGSRPMSTTDLPTLTRPTAPPSEPSDRITGLWVAGEVTEGGDGPCYTLAGDDGQTFVVNGSGGTLAAGDRVKMRILQPPRAVYCGTVEAWSLQEVQPAG